VFLEHGFFPKLVEYGNKSLRKKMNVLESINESELCVSFLARMED